MKQENNKKSGLKKLSQQKSTIKTLKELLIYYQEITDTVREPFIILDKNLCVVTANQAFYDTFKVLKTHTEGELIYQLGNNQWDSPKLRELLENILPKKKVMNDFEVKHDFPDIGTKIMLLNARQVDHKQLILLAIEDITKLKKFQSDSDEMTANLTRQHTKLKALGDAKDEFVEMASHQLRTPATIVKQYAGMLREGYAGELSKAQAEMLDSAIIGNERQLEIIEDLLKVARVDAGKVSLAKKNHNITQLIEDVVKKQLVTFEKRDQSIVFNQPTKMICVDMDAKLIRMVLENLLDNASKYSRVNKTITIGLKQSKAQTTITIDDSGVGILKDDQKKLFKKFSRIDNPLSIATEGTGLGLYWVKKIVDLHDGQIEVKSVINKGSIFTIKLPIHSTDTGPREVILV
ncbi:PAS domain-containing sensor histidine kinase [Candidatus Saccharibacteria bacterium]|nr:PAS domain-containing sensor histidine kinase [Candidatus Saccharibacteria bacterium]